MTIEKLRFLLEYLGSDHFDGIDDAAKALNAMIDLAPEILALVEAASEDDERRFKGSFFVSPTIKAIRAFNAKLASL